MQGVARVGGMNLKGVFTRTRQPKMAAHTLREWWINKAMAGRSAGVGVGAQTAAWHRGLLGCGQRGWACKKR